MNKLSFQQAQEFQTSGLVHLLAISGAQIVPVASLFSTIFASGFYYAFRKRHSSIQLMLRIYKIKSTIHFLVSLFISLLFGCTGALLRVAGLSFLSRIKFVQSLCENSYSIIPNLIENTALKIILLILLSIFFGNVFINYSFILSAIGASCAELSGIFVYSPLFKTDGKNKLERIFGFLLQSHIGKHLISAVLTSALVGILLSPLVYNSLLNSCLANICAIPIVTFLVTPLALLVLIIPENQDLYFLTLKCLDFSLSLFQKIASTFSDHHIFINPFNRHNPLFTAEGLCYLNTLLIILWILVDILRYRKVFYMRSCMSSRL
jgi:predicted membrane metal-binding protein